MLLQIVLSFACASVISRADQSADPTDVVLTAAQDMAQLVHQPIEPAARVARALEISIALHQNLTGVEELSADNQAVIETISEDFGLIFESAAAATPEAVRILERQEWPLGPHEDKFRIGAGLFLGAGLAAATAILFSDLGTPFARHLLFYGTNLLAVIPMYVVHAVADRGQKAIDDQKLRDVMNVFGCGRLFETAEAQGN